MSQTPTVSWHLCDHWKQSGQVAARPFGSFLFMRRLVFVAICSAALSLQSSMGAPASTDAPNLGHARNASWGDAKNHWQLGVDMLRLQGWEPSQWFYCNVFIRSTEVKYDGVAYSNGRVEPSDYVRWALFQSNGVPVALKAGERKYPTVEKLMATGMKVRAARSRKLTQPLEIAHQDPLELVSLLPLKHFDIRSPGTYRLRVQARVLVPGPDTVLEEMWLPTAETYFEVRTVDLQPPNPARLSQSHQEPAKVEMTPTMSRDLIGPVMRNSYEVVARLVNEGANVEQRDFMGWTPLMWALDNGSLDSAEVLLKAGANLQAVDWEGNSPLHQVMAKSRTRWLRGQMRGPTPASQQWGSRIGAYLLAQGASVTATNLMGQTPLHMLSLHGESGDKPADFLEAIVADHLAYKADINAHDTNGRTPLHLAVFRDRYPSVHALLSHGADVNCKDSQGLTPLHMALGTGQGKIRMKSLTNHTDLNARSLPEAASGPEFSPKDLELVRLLIKFKADINSPDITGRTPLQMAEQIKNPALLEILRAKPDQE